MSVEHRVARYQYVFTWASILTALAGTALHANTIIAHIHSVVNNQHVAAVAHIYAITVLCIPRTAHRHAINNNIIATLWHNMKFGRVLYSHSLYKYIFTICKPDEMRPHLFLHFSITGHIIIVLQVERIPHVTLGTQGATHVHKRVPLVIAYLAALHRAPPFSIAVYDTFSGDAYILALARIDSRCGAVFHLTCELVRLYHVLLVG